MSALALLTRLAGKKVDKSFLNQVIKTAKSFIKDNPGKSRVDILDHVGKKYGLNLTRLRADNVREIISRRAKHNADRLLKTKEFFTPSQLKKIDNDALSAVKGQQWKEGILGTEAHIKKLSRAQKNRYQIALETPHPETGELGYSTNSAIQRAVDYAKAGIAPQGSSTYAKAQAQFAKEWGKGALKKVRDQEDFVEAWMIRRQEALELMNGRIDKLTPASEILTKHGQWGYRGLLDERKALRETIFDEGGDLYPFMSDKLGLSRSEIVPGLSHDWQLKGITSLFANKGRPNMSVERAIQLASDPRNIKADPNFMNVGKLPIENYIYQKPLLSASDLEPLSKVMKHGQVRSKLYSPTGKREQIGMPGRDIDPKQLLDYLNILYKDQPFGRAASGKIRPLPIRKYIEALLEGKQKWNYQAGGLASLLGKKMLKKLAGKLSEKELKMLMGSLWKGVDPRRSPRYRVWDKKRWGPGYKWPWKKSRIKGPEIKKSHFANLSPGERVELQSKNADELWEYQMKRKLNKPVGEALEYPFLNPDKNSFIVTGPREGLGRYQLQHYVDPEDVKPIQKYKVYDWWDDILNKMHKKPKFKYVKDDKGKIILKEAK